MGLDMGRSIRKVFLNAAMVISSLSPVLSQAQSNDSTMVNNVATELMVTDTGEVAAAAKKHPWSNDERYQAKLKAAEEDRRIAQEAADKRLALAEKN